MVDQIKEANRAAGGEDLLGCPVLALLIRRGDGEERRDVNQGKTRGMHFRSDTVRRGKPTLSCDLSSVADMGDNCKDNKAQSRLISIYTKRSGMIERQSA